MSHNLKPLKIDDEDAPFIFKTKFLKTFFICHMSLCNLLIFMLIYRWHQLYADGKVFCWPLISFTLVTNVFCN
jgi:hypothetical protein